MATLEAAKLSYLHKKILERYLEGPTADDEEILKLMDLQNNRPAVTYQAMGQQEHPIYARDRWLSEAAAKLTDDGYWAWVTKQINANPGYRFDGVAVVDVVPAETYPNDWGLSADAPSPLQMLLNTPPPPPVPTFPTMPAPRQPRTPRAAIPAGYSGEDNFGEEPLDAPVPYSL